MYRVCRGAKSAWGVHYRCMGWSKMLFKERLIETKRDYFVEDVLYMFRFLTGLLHTIWNEDVGGNGKGRIGGLF